MASSEKFSLKWPHSQANLRSVFANLREDTSLTDVTLVSEDGQQFEAHKVILSTSSPVLSNILKTTSQSNPLIMLMGFQAKELHILLDFMYSGTANVSYDSLDDFLDQAKELKIYGLTEGPGLKTEEQKNNLIMDFDEVSKSGELMLKGFLEEPGVKSETEIIQCSEKFARFQDQKHTMNQVSKSIGMTESWKTPNFLGDVPVGNKYKCLICDQIFRFKSSLTRHNYRIHQIIGTTSNNLSPIVYFSSESSNKKAILCSMISWNGTVLACMVCGKTTDKKTDKHAKAKMEQHIETMHTEGGLYKCSKCDNSFKSKTSLYQHTYRSHK